jgi:hypothetical protein
VPRCKLTLKEGSYVDSHLIPKALTRPATRGSPLIQAGMGSKPVRRWTSWYDSELVTAEGEKVLSDFDNWAIVELRKHKLVWSGWGPMQKLAVKDHDRFDNNFGARKVCGIDPTRLRLFFLSLLWRAAATQRPEFSAIELDEEDTESLRVMLLEGRPEPLNFYPIQLSQLSSLGSIHNLTPIADVKVIPSYDDNEANEKHVPYFRFYFDGLIAHIHRQSSDDGDTRELGTMVVGAGNELTVSTITYEASFQKRNFEQIQFEVERDWPALLSRY